MPSPEPGKSIEEMYWDHVRAMSPAEKIRKSFAMFQSYYNEAANRYRKEHPDVSDREVRIAMAKRLYGGDPRTMVLIEMAEKELRDQK
jgi:uncharacterized protein YeaO (DUF488 family)